MILAVPIINSCASLADPTNVSDTSPSSTTPDTIVFDLTLASTTADKAVKAILPFLKDLSDDQWWTGLLAAWIGFEVEGPPKSVSSFDILI